MADLKLFRIIAFFEGLSYILLLFVAVPMKYGYNDPKFVKILGMPHGLLFVAYIIFAIYFWNEFKVDQHKKWFILLASVIPFGTFYIDYKYLRLKNE
ncbi:MAG: DUF3817 domain-containing protein [Winogradskyella sp.]|nr:DUF3817 domain-containing protein [Bacteroidia bacterium]NNC44826.1 DUF3817 domain-containing protein [Winogradskyella sp.]NNF85861.1 DUF3817 domain-containing protein [Winogradskyella sp.]